MKLINLRTFYPSLYRTDTFMLVPDEIEDALVKAKRKEKAMYAKIAYHGAFYSLDRADGIEHHALLLPPQPEEVIEKKQFRTFLYSAIMELPSKQAKRLYAYFILRMKLSDIARIEGVNEPAISKSIQRALKKLRAKFIIYLKNGKK